MAKTAPRKYENCRVSRIPPYEPLRLNGWIELMGEGKKVVLKRTVKTKADHIPLTAERIAQLAAEQGIKCTVHDLVATKPDFVPPKIAETETAETEATEVTS